MTKLMLHLSVINNEDSLGCKRTKFSIQTALNESLIC